LPDSPTVLKTFLSLKPRVLTSLSINADIVLPVVESALLDCRTNLLEICPGLESLQIYDMGYTVKCRLSKPSLDLFDEMLSQAIHLRVITTNLIRLKFRYLGCNRGFPQRPILFDHLSGLIPEPGLPPAAPISHSFNVYRGR
jgi:hypothetical protein